MVLIFQRRSNGELQEWSTNFFLAQFTIMAAWICGLSLVLEPMEFTLYRYFAGRPRI